jgi:hypothetical protein
MKKTAGQPKHQRQKQLDNSSTNDKNSWTTQAQMTKTVGNSAPFTVHMFATQATNITGSNLMQRL